MSDINVIVNDFPVNITVSQGGIQGPPGSNGIPGTPGTGGNFTSVEVTGSLVLPIANLTGTNGIIISVGSNNITTIDGSSFALNSQTGSFITSGQTGAFGGNFYPLVGNPSGFVTGNVIRQSDTGNFIVNSQTGQFYSSSNPSNFITPAQSGLLTGQFYPLFGNPSSFVLTSNTGNFATIKITGSSNLILANFTGINGAIITLGQSGIINIDGSNFVLNSNTGNFITSSQTGNLTNTFYPLNSNPAGYVSSATAGSAIKITGSVALVTGNFTGINGSIVSLGASGLVNIDGSNFTLNTNTGSFITVNQTGAFYPLIGNPSLFITQSQTGAFQPVSITGSIPNYINFTGISGITIDILGITGRINGNNLQNQINTVTSWTGTTTSIFAQANQTGTFISSSQTGNLTGQFYPLLTNPSGYATTGFVINSLGGGQVYYYQSGLDANSPPYFQLIDTVPTSNVNASISTTLVIGNGQQLLTGFVTSSGDPGVSQIPPGLWLFNLYGSSSLLTNNSYLVNSMYSLGTTGLETFLFSVTGSALTSTTQLNSIYYINSGITLNPGDRLISKVYALTNNILSTSVTFNYQGAGVASHVSTPLDFGYNYYTTKFVSQSQTGNFITTSQTGGFAPYGRIYSKSITIPNPTNTDVFTMFYVNNPITINKITSVLVGSVSPLTSGTVLFAWDRSSAGTEIINNGFTVSSTTTGSNYTNLNNTAIGTGNWVFIKITGVVGTVTEQNTTLHYSYQ